MDNTLILTLLSVIQGLIGLAMAAVTLQLGGIRLRMFRRVLAASFAALGLFHVTAILALWLGGLGPQWVMTRTAVSVLSQSLSVIHLAGLGLAFYLMAQRRPLPRGTFRAVAIVSVLVGLAIVLPGAFEDAARDLRVVLRVGVRSLIATLAYVALSLLIYAHHPQSGRSLGQWLVLGSMVLLALGNGINAAVGLDPSRIGWAADFTVWVQIVGVIGQMGLAVAILVWVQERTQAVAESKTQSAERLARFDEATGLPNRHGLLRRIDREVLPEAPLTLMVVRVQRYSMLERTLGAAWMRTALLRLGEALGTGREVHALGTGRIDSDRLAVPLPIDRALAEVDVLARRRKVEATAQALGHPVSMSFGYAVRQHRESAELLLASACLAQEKAELGGMRMLRYEPEQAQSDAEEIETLSGLYRAIGDDQLFLEFQGIFAADDLTLDSVEALLRWRHPSDGILPPGRFLPAAERGGLMGDIDAWVLDRVCRTLRERLDAGLPEVPVAMNLSSASVLDIGLVATVEAQLRRNRVPPHLLELEITESAAMHDLGRASEVVNALRELGVRIALDDLGTGYSSLSFIRELRADRLKIDRSFIADGDRFGSAIAIAIAALGRSIGVDVVAEGVETESQLAFCRQHGIGNVQGWLLHRPSVRWPTAIDAAPTPAA